MVPLGVTSHHRCLYILHLPRLRAGVVGRLLALRVLCKMIVSNRLGLASLASDALREPLDVLGDQTALGVSRSTGYQGAQRLTCLSET